MTTKPTEGEALEAVRTLIRWAGDDPDREGLTDTPARVLRAYDEWFAGYRDDAATHLRTTFGLEGYDELVLVGPIEFHSMCEHHMAPFRGVAHVGYIPRKSRVVGLSKLARTVEVFARRLQIQERLTREVATAVQEHLDPLGVGVVVRASHGCMTSRGVRQHAAEMVTSDMRGVFRTRAAARAEFLSLVGLS